LADKVVDLARQQTFQWPQCVDTGFVRIGDRKIFPIHEHHIDRHLIKHLRLLVCFFFHANFVRNDTPRQHRGNVIALLIVQRGHQKVQNLVADRNFRLMRQVRRIGQHFALMLRRFVKDIDTLAENFIGGDRQDMLDRF